MVEEEKGKYELDQKTARHIIDRVGGTGTPPEFGFQFFTAGLDEYLNVIEDEYLKSFILDGGSVFKLIVGIYGGGKTHFLYSVRELAWKYDYITAYVTLRPNDTPFHKLPKIYEAIAQNLLYKQSRDELLSGYDRGIEAVIKKWFFDKKQEFMEKAPDNYVEELEKYVKDLGPYESTTFKNAVKHAFLSLLRNNSDDFNIIIQWLKAEKITISQIRRFDMNERIDKSTAFKMIRSLVQWIHNIDYSGIIVLLDEAEQIPSMSTKDKSILLSNLRELIDLCSQVTFIFSMWFYAVPDETFLEGGTSIYEALKQRIATIFNAEINPTGVKIKLENLPKEPLELLKEIGLKLAKIYEVAYGISLDNKVTEETIKNMAQAAYERRFDIGYKREFVKYLIPALHTQRRTSNVVTYADISSLIE